MNIHFEEIWPTIYADRKNNILLNLPYGDFQKYSIDFNGGINNFSCLDRAIKSLTDSGHSVTFESTKEIKIKSN